MRAIWRVVFSSGEGEKAQEYFLYFKLLRQRQAGKMLAQRMRRLIWRLQITEYCNERIEAQLSEVAPVSKACKAVAGVKGAAAEGGGAANPAWSLG